MIGADQPTEVPCDEGRSSMPALSVRKLAAGWGGVPAVRELSLEVSPGEVVALLGPNGAGKSTTLLTLAGILKPLGGETFLMGEPLEGLAPHQVARRGLALLTEDRSIFYQLTVAENLRLHRHRRSRVKQSDVLGWFPALQPLLNRKAGLLSGGEQQMLALGCKLISDPKLLMIDEMSLGLAPIVVNRLLTFIRGIADEAGTAVLLVEQHVHTALSVSDRAYVLSHGELVLTGPVEELVQRPEVLEASYFGERTLDKIGGQEILS